MKYSLCKKQSIQKESKLQMTISEIPLQVRQHGVFYFIWYVAGNTFADELVTCACGHICLGMGGLIPSLGTTAPLHKLFDSSYCIFHVPTHDKQDLEMPSKSVLIRTILPYLSRHCFQMYSLYSTFISSRTHFFQIIRLCHTLIVRQNTSSHHQN